MQRGVRPEDVLAFQGVGDPQISPDGRRVVYVVQTIDGTKQKPTSALWVVDVDGGAPRRLTNPQKGRDHSPRWSPDGSAVAFISDRAGKPQLWVIRLDGGEARRIETPQAPAEFSWSPDGTQIAYSARVFDQPPDWLPYPGAPACDRERAAELAVENGGEAGGEPKPRNSTRVITRLKYRMDGVGYYGDKRSHIFVVPVAGGPVRQLTAGDYDHTMPAWAPDGRSLVCCALRRPDADWHNRNDLWRIDLAAGELSLLLEHAGPAWTPVWSPDGRYVAFGGHDNASAGSTSAQCLVLEVATGQVRSLSAPLDRPMGVVGASDVRYALPFVPPAWAPDSRAVYFIVTDRGDSHVYAAPVDGGRPWRVTEADGGGVAAFSISRTGRLALQRGGMTQPDEIWAGGRRLTSHNDPLLAELHLLPPERFTYTGAQGWPMEGWVIRPAGYEAGRRYPTILSIHGGPHGAYGPLFMVMFQMLAAAGFAVVYTNPRGSQSYGQEFALAVVGDWGGADYDDIQLGLDAVIGMGIADPERLGVMGWSYGGFMTAWTITRTSRFKAAISGAPVANQYNFIGTTDIPWFMHWHAGQADPWTPEGAEKLLDRSPIRYADRVTTPTLVMCGEGDLRCPIEQAEQFYMALRRQGKTAVQVRYPGQYHAITEPVLKLDRYRRTLAWFQHYLAPATP